MIEFRNHQKVTCEQLEEAYAEEMERYVANHIKRDFDKYTECFWLLFNDGVNSYMWAVDTVCENFPECNRNELENVLDKYI